MGRVKVIQKSRKECVCGKCRKTIPVGSKYYKGELFRQPPIIRCTDCGLKHYEVTTSDYVRTVGAIVEDWSEDYPVEDGVWETIAEALEELKDELEERLENMPEQLHEGDSGTTLQERIEALESVISSLTDYDDMDDFLQNAYEELGEEMQEVIDKAKEARDDADFSGWYQDFWEKADVQAAYENGKAAAEAWKERTEELITEFVENALGELEY